MLTEILALLEDGQACSLEELAMKLESDVPTVKAQIEYLVQLGFLKQIRAEVPACNGCTGCSQGKSCDLDFTPYLMWERVK
ncbi:FeoC-like transcriptional regulator [Anaerocolumna sp. AGMB13025]|uniref:FeoC-like transcriptional regulator n=1 Tax=Anaerocolumna sp. AGMB13025 TaxID=3039116 RepID=UPI00241CF366|nr:FeoC-like transcriptional regulator [Anaerocolumna sp. AGMB13025]WFR59202.1 FeoC-like transcriptional regulator [Anaerocolumna sp. AGMB13025]